MYHVDRCMPFPDRLSVEVEGRLPDVSHPKFLADLLFGLMLTIDESSNQTVARHPGHLDPSHCYSWHRARSRQLRSQRAASPACFAETVWAAAAAAAMEMTLPDGNSIVAAAVVYDDCDV